MNESVKYIFEKYKYNNLPVHLHLGCGGKHLNNCINIDFPQEEQPLVKSAADVSADIVQLDFPTESVDSIQLHHVFEHFSRGVALGLLCKWNRWLKVKGQLKITVPDAEACCRGIGSSLPLNEKMRLIRHIAGSHEEDKWSFHIDQWFEERFWNTLGKLNFKILKINKITRSEGIFDLEVLSEKFNNTVMEDMISNAIDLLWESTLHVVELPMLNIWKDKMIDVIYSGRS